MTNLNGLGGQLSDSARCLAQRSSIGVVVALLCVTHVHASQVEPPLVQSESLTFHFDAATGLPAQMETQVSSVPHSWLQGPIRFRVRNEVSDTVATWGSIPVSGWQRESGLYRGRGSLNGLPLEVHQQWSRCGNAVAWSLDFRGEAKRVGHEVTIDLPILDDTLQVFTPTERGTLEVAVHRDFQGLPYAALGWDTGQSWVLPLVSVMDPQTDEALTVALPADANIPHLQISWQAGRTLRITLGHRGMGGAGQASPLTLLFFAHAADYRAALGAYVQAFPDYFRTPLPRGPYEGTFYYHHIQDQPDPAELAEQRVRYIWSSFWFTFLGEYLPDATEWEPYTYAKWWKLGESISDDKIRSFVRAMRARGIGTYAYFNVTEYGGAGGKSGDAAQAAQILRTRFADALVKNQQGQDIPTWEGAMAMNPGSQYSLSPELDKQVRRHLLRLPEIEGFVIDRLDWASLFDYGHHDGLSMIGDSPVENLALPVGEAVHHVVELSHAAGKRVFVNQFYRIEVLRDVDGVCHENDYVPALGYLVPLRPASAWHFRRPYQGDLLAFESQLKLRLQWAVFPQMIAHQFPISQQRPDPRAADFLTLYAPLFDALLGKEQVLLPHCVSVSGNNDVNLFVNQQGHYIIPVTSRGQFLARKARDTQSVTVTLRTPAARQIQWAHAISADGDNCRVQVQVRDTEVQISLDRHVTATVLVAGSGPEPELPRTDQARCTAIRDRLAAPAAPAASLTERPEHVPSGRLLWRIAGTHVGSPGPVQVLVDDDVIGRFAERADHAWGTWTPAALHDPPVIVLSTSDEGTWFVPERMEILAPGVGDTAQRLAVWQVGMDMSAESTRSRLVLPTAWSVADLRLPTATAQTRDVNSQGQWKNRLGSRGAWIAGASELSPGASGYQLSLLSGKAYRWPVLSEDDPRVLEPVKEDRRQPTCWFANEQLQLRLDAPDTQPYRLTLYLLDYDRNGRGAKVSLSDDFAPLSSAEVSTRETAGGVYLTWTVTGNVHIQLQKTAGFNAVLSGVFIDR